MKLQIKTLRAAIVGYFLNLIYYFKKSNNHESVKMEDPPLVEYNQSEPEVMQETNQSENPIMIDIKQIVRITSVRTVKVVEHHYLAVSFDGQPPTMLQVPKDDLSDFTIGKELIVLPGGLHPLNRAPVVH
ncbi:MAG: hypothetical protein LLG05_08410 [Porphyromonadaceae bacterium]|jgi:hypothetical protein|nr:hypothetical protein [Porphyromonadaceae bacterium]